MLVPKVLLQYKGVRRLYPLVVVFFLLYYLESKVLVKINGFVVACLDMPTTERDPWNWNIYVTIQTRLIK